MRGKIREAALRLFVEKGYANTSIADIEQASGLAPRSGGFYRHFRSKADLAVEIGQTSIIETRQDLGFEHLPLGDTRAELVLIAKGNLLAAARQAPLAGLITEIRNLAPIKELETRVSADLLAALTDWLATKPFARHLSATELAALALTVFGGWLVYLSKRGSGIVPELTDDLMLAEWADLWASLLDGPPAG